MMLDDQLLVSRSQVVTATGNSTDYIDHGRAVSLGAGEEMEIMINITAVSGTSPTLTVAWTGADDSAFSTNKITIATVTPTLVSGTPNGFVRVGVPAHLSKRYMRAEFTVGGTSPSITLSVALVKNEQTEITRRA